MTDNGKKAFELIQKYIKKNEEVFTASDLSEKAGIKISGNTLPSIAKEGYLKKVDTNPAKYLYIADSTEEAYNNLEGLYHSLNDTSNWPNFKDYSFMENMVYAGQLIPDRANEKIVWTPNELFDDNYQGLCYAFVVNGKFYKQGKTDTTLKERISSYNCGKQEYRNNGTCSVTNYFVLQSILNFNVPVDVYVYYIPKATLKIFGKEVEINTSPAKYVEGLLLNQAIKDFGEKLPGCFQN